MREFQSITPSERLTRSALIREDRRGLGARLSPVAECSDKADQQQRDAGPLRDRRGRGTRTLLASAALEQKEAKNSRKEEKNQEKNSASILLTFGESEGAPAEAEKSDQPDEDANMDPECDNHTDDPHWNLAK